MNYEESVDEYMASVKHLATPEGSAGVFFESKHGLSYEWQSFEDWLVDEERLGKLKPTHYSKVKEISDGASKWSGTPGGYDAFRKLMLYGWPERREKLERMMAHEDIQAKITQGRGMTRRRKIQRGDHGDHLDQERVWMGDLENAWTRPVKMNRLTSTSKNVTLVFDVSASGGVSDEDSLWRAGLCMALTDSIARSGRTYEVWIIDSTFSAFQKHAHKCPNRLWSAFRVKASGDPVNMDRLCGMLGVGFMRTTGFLAMSAYLSDPGWGYGCALRAGLPHTLHQRRLQGETIIRVSDGFSRADMLKQYDLVWQEIESLKI